MRINELFTGTYQTTEMDRSEINDVFRTNTESIVRAWEVQLPGRPLVWVFISKTKNKRGEMLTCDFAQEKFGKFRLDFDQTGAGSPFKVYGAVAQCLRLFIEESKPDLIKISGFEEKQEQLYRKILGRAQLPAGYKFYAGPAPKGWWYSYNDFCAIYADGSEFAKALENERGDPEAAS